MIALILVVLALGTGVYALTVDSFAWEDLVFGLGATIVLLAIFWRVLMPARMPSNGQILKAIVMLPVYALVILWDVIIGTWDVATFVLGLRRMEHPGIVRVPLGDRTKTGTGVSSMALTLSPGTFLVDVDWEKREMLIHAIDASDPDAVREGLNRTYDRVQRHVVP